MQKVTWKANRVISIETKRKDENRKENVYVLAQMINKAPILFCTYVARQFIANSNVYIQDIEPLKDYEPPKYQIDSIGARVRKITLWEGTKDEKEIAVLGEGGGRLIEGDIDGSVIIAQIPFTDDETIDKYELTDVRIYAEFDERLYLCYKFGKNVDPMKDLAFNRPIPLEYKEYIDIISSSK